MDLGKSEGRSPDPVVELVRFIVGHESWQERAACRGVPNPDMFFPERGQSRKEAKKMCAECPVSDECNEYASRTGTTYGIWGGQVLQR